MKDSTPDLFVRSSGVEGRTPDVEPETVSFLDSAPGIWYFYPDLWGGVKLGQILVIPHRRYSPRPDLRRLVELVKVQCRRYSPDGRRSFTSASLSPCRDTHQRRIVGTIAPLAFDVRVIPWVGGWWGVVFYDTSWCFFQGPPPQGDRMTGMVWMDRALTLARRRQGLTAPNPPVGAVLVKNGQVIGEGAHWGPGHPHAEVVALEDARSRGNDPRGSVLYVTLEPCCHAGPHKRTPPCAQRLIQEGISEVYAAVADPNPEVSGGGMTLLAAAGVKVHWGPGELEARELIADFSAWVGARRPFITLKWAQSLDGQTSDPVHRWITGEEARNHSQVLRAEHDAVAVGAGTVRVDDPRLTVRVPAAAGRTHPRRLIFAGAQTLPESAQVFTDSDKERTWIVVHSRGKVWEQAQALAPGRVLEWDGTDAAALGEVLLNAAFYRVFVEGGPTLLNFFYRAGMWDRAAVFIAPLWLKGIRPQTAEGPSVALRLDQPQWSVWGQDVCVDGWNPASPALRVLHQEGGIVCSPV